MKKVLPIILLLTLLTGCNAGAGSDTYEPAYGVEAEVLFTYPDSGVSSTVDCNKIAFKYKNNLVIERSYMYEDGKFTQLIINIYPCEDFDYADIDEVVKDASFTETNGYYTATVTSGAEVATVMSMSKEDMFAALELQFDNLTSR